jgi:hypothetical protein
MPPFQPGSSPSAVARRDRPPHCLRASWSRPLILLFALALALALIQSYAWYVGVRARGGLDQFVRQQTDFAPLLTGALLVRDGKGAQLYDFAAQRAAQAQIAPLAPGARRDLVNIYNHPPFEAVLVAPLLGLPYSVVFGLWTLAAISAFGLALWVLSTVLPVRGALQAIMIGVACAYHPLHLGLWLGQNSAFVLLGLCGVYASWQQRRDGWLALSLILLALKPQVLPLIVLALMLQRRWRALLIAAGLVSGLSVAMMPILGVWWPVRYGQYLLGVSNAGARVAEHPERMHNWRGFTLNLAGSVAPAFVTPLLLLLSFATAGAILWCWWRLGKAPGSACTTLHADLSFAATCVAAIVLAPHLHAHDLLLLIVPAWIVAAYTAAGAWTPPWTRGWVSIFWLGWLLPLCMFLLPLDERIGVIASVTLMALVITLLLRQSDSGLAWNTLWRTDSSSA